MRIIAAIIAVLLMCQSSFGQVIPGRWEKVEAQPMGRLIRMHLKSGMRLDGVMKSLQADDMDILLTTGTAMKVARTDVRDIRTIVVDSNWNGALIGMGAVGGLVGAAAAAAASEGDLADGNGWVAAAILVYAGIGGLLGYVIDDAIDHSEMLYRAQ